jgi:nucleoside-diphosphate-sugar epimerase
MQLLNEDIDLILEENELILNSLNYTRIFITGSTGFMGSWLVETLRQAYRQLGLRAHITLMCHAMPDTPCHDVFDYVIKDLTEVTAWSNLGEYDFVLHLANSRHFDPMEAFRINTQGMDGMLDHFLERCRTFLFTSSGAVYKQTIPETTKEDAYLGAPPLPITPKDSYRASKMVCEYMMKRHVMESNFITLRPFTFYGPGLNENFAISEFMRTAQLSNDIQVRSKNTLRSYMYPTDLVKWILTIMFRSWSQNKVFNVGSPTGYSFQQVAEAIAYVYGVKVELAPATEYSPDYVPTVEEATRMFGLTNTISFDEGIRRWKKYQALYGSF